MTREMKSFKTTMNGLCRQAQIDYLQNSNLTDKELDLLMKRFVKGFSLKDCAEELGVEIDTVNKFQKRAVLKLFQFYAN